MKGLSPLLALCLLSALALAPAVLALDQPASSQHGEWVDVHTPPTENECRSFIEKALKEQRSQTETSGEEIIGEAEYLSEGAAHEDLKEAEAESREEDINLIPDTTDDEGKDDGDTLNIEIDKTENNEDKQEDNKVDQQEETLKTEEDGADVEENVADSKSNEESANDDTSKEIDEAREEEREAVESQESIKTQEGDEQVLSGESVEEIIVDDVSNEDTNKEDSKENIEDSENKSEDNLAQSLEEEISQGAGQETEQGTEQDTDQGTGDSIEDASVEEENTGKQNENEDSTESSTKDSVEERKITEDVASNEDTSPDKTDDTVIEESSVREKRSAVTSAEDDKPEESLEEATENLENDEVEHVTELENQSVGEEETTENDILAEKSTQPTEDASEEKVGDVQEEGPLEEMEQSVEAVNKTEEMTEPKEEATESEGKQVPESEGSSFNEPDTSINANDTAETNETDVEESKSDDTLVDDISEDESPDEEDLALKMEIPEKLRPRNHIAEILQLDPDSMERDAQIRKAEESTLKELKRLYEAAIKPLEILFKYRDLSNRHFGDAEVFSKPLILFMGPWSGGKSTIINYLLDNEYKKTALRTGAEPSPAYFNIVMKGERDEVLDGTQLAADWTFSALAKFGQGLVDRLRGLKLNHSLLEKVNIVEIPGILEIRKQVERLFPFNDACQWFIDRADIIFLVYDPSKLDVGPETEAILDQLKGREYQTKIILNKADQVRPEELMRVQGTLVWNISPLMSSTEPPVMYSTSLWSAPYQSGAPVRLLFAQEKAFLRDLRDAIYNRVENKISSARRFAVRVRNHAKMVDCYLTTYYNHKSFFGNKKKVSDDIIEHPQNYHIYEGLSTLTNISRYDLPDPDVYRDFFRLNPVYEFQQLASTCTYFKGCPINRLDVAIAYDLPELVGKYKKLTEHLSSAKSP